MKQIIAPVFFNIQAPTPGNNIFLISCEFRI